MGLHQAQVEDCGAKIVVDHARRKVSDTALKLYFS
jgi:hypothetical protein